MAGAGISSIAELGRRMRVRGKPVGRQTVHRWFSGEGEHIWPEQLFALAEALNCNPQWLAVGPPHLPMKPFFPDLEQSELMQIFNSLPDQAKEQWISQGRGLVQILSPVSTSNPFKQKVK